YYQPARSLGDLQLLGPKVRVCRPDPVLAIPGNCVGNAVRERHTCLPTEVRLGPRGVEQDRRSVLLRSRPNLDLLVELDPHRVDHGVEELLDRMVGPGGHVVDALAGPFEGSDHHLEQVVHVDEVSPGINHEAGLVLAEALEEGGKWAADVAGPVDVGE